MKCAGLDASPQRPSLELIIGGFASKAEQGLIGFAYMHVLVMHNMSSLIYSLSLMSIGQRGTPNPANSRVRLWALVIFVLLNSISIQNLKKLNLKKYSVSRILYSASFYNFVIGIQCYLRPHMMLGKLLSDQ